MDLNFSQRVGVSPITKPFQLNSIDDELKNELWNIFYEHILKKTGPNLNNGSAQLLANWLWKEFFRRRVDEAPINWYSLLDVIKGDFYEFSWDETYRFMEFSLYFPFINKLDYISTLNRILERQFSGYRMINDIIVPISNQIEVDEINSAINVNKQYTPLDGVNIHLASALKFLSDRVNPNYRNSVKESISAVESACRIATKSNSLSDALNNLESAGVFINKQLKESFIKIYAFTNDKTSGIRHAIIDAHDPPDFETAKYMLVASSAFINYLIPLANRANLFKK
jgi:hypothetical protein